MLSLHTPPLHERVRLLGWVRRPLRNALFAFLRKLSATEDARGLAASTLRGLAEPHPELLPAPDAAPYPELGGARPESQTSQRSDIIFITGRFRSGSTLLWNLFRNLDGYVSYYEPLNERRWFDPRVRGSRMDPTHRNIEGNYWSEYDGLEELGQYYRDSWTCRHLFMDGNAWEPDLKRYVEIMVEKAPGRPVLQFNRIDFRLPWFRRQFPNARLLHVYRHPRDQWCSSLMDPRAYPCSAAMSDFGPHDHFYLLNWARDLKYQFPFLDEQTVSHPYQLFYHIWKLSYLFGRKFSDHSIALEDLVADTPARLRELLAAMDVSTYDMERLTRLIARPVLGKWRDYADDGWFRAHEEACEDVLSNFLDRRREVAAPNDADGPQLGLSQLAIPLGGRSSPP